MKLPLGGRLVPRKGHTGTQCWSLLFSQRGLEEGHADTTHQGFKPSCSKRARLWWDAFSELRGA